MIPRARAKHILERLLAEITDKYGFPATDRLDGPRAIAVRVESFKAVLTELPIRFDVLVRRLENEREINEGSAEERLHSLANYCRVVLGLLEAEAALDEVRRERAASLEAAREAKAGAGTRPAG